MGIDACVGRLNRYHYAFLRLHEILTAHITGEPLYELKTGFSHHAYLCAEHVQALRTRVGEMPIFLLDDVLSELDTAHREAFCRGLPEGAQTLLTAAVLTSIPDALRRGATVTEVSRTR